MPEFSSYEVKKQLQIEYTVMKEWQENTGGDVVNSGNSIRDWMNGPDWAPLNYIEVFVNEYTNIKSVEVSGEIQCMIPF